MDNFYDLMSVDIPEGELDGMSVKRFTVEADSIGGMRQALKGRPVTPGTYTKLTGDGKFWMSDTPAERSDHGPFLHKALELKAERVLINGLGLGMVLRAVLSFDHVRHVDVVEVDKRVIKLVGPHYAVDPRVHIHHADAREKNWPVGTRWDVGWSDIWPNVSTDDLSDMTKMNRSYGRRCTWHGCWGQERLIRSARTGW